MTRTQGGFLIIFSILLIFSLVTIKDQTYSQNHLDDATMVVFEPKINDQHCNSTHFVYQNNISLARQDQLNRTFAKIAQKVTLLSNITENVSENITFSIYNLRPKFDYLDKNQKAQTIGNDTIVIWGGKLEVQIEFQWSKNTSQQQQIIGNGVIQIQTQVIFAKRLFVQDFTYNYELLDWQEVSLYGDMEMISLQPADTENFDRALILRILNSRNDITSLRFDLQQNIKNYFSYYLRTFISDPNQLTEKLFQYIWIDSVVERGNLSIQFERKIRQLYMEKNELSYEYQMRIKNYQNWKCGAQQARLPLDPRVYGGGQQIVSISFYQNVLRYAIQKGIFDSILNKKYWETNTFKFTVGELSKVIPKLTDQFNLEDEVYGNCSVSKNNFKISFMNYETNKKNEFKVELETKCELSASARQFSKFTLNLGLVVKGVPSRSFLDFQLSKINKIINFEIIDNYEITNVEQSKQMIGQSLDRLFDQKLFGSGWPLFPKRDFPEFHLSDKLACIYDPTQIIESDR